MTTLEERFSKPGPKRILSLDGGGIKGILTLAILERMESLLRQQHDNTKFLLSDYFDLIGGTSTGSIIASGLAMGMTVSEISGYYNTLAKGIFGKRKSILAYLSRGEKYDIKPLNNALKKVFKNTRLGDQEKLKTGLCIVTKRADTFSTWPFHNHPGGRFYNYNKDLPLWKVIRASAAAPTYFLPIVLDIGQGEKGTFIDGGISMANNPSLTLFLVATLKGFPFHWSVGRNKLCLVSVGTGSLSRKYTYKDLEKMNIMKWAGMLPDHFMTDANYYNQIIMQMLSDSQTASTMDSEMGDLRNDSLNGSQFLTYLRYDVPYEQEYLKQLGFEFTPDKIKELSAMDNYRNISSLYEIGKAAADIQLKDEHFQKIFALDNPSDQQIRRYTPNKDLGLDFEKVQKKPITVEAVQIEEPFEVETLEGIMQGKAGDYLMKGVRGELYVCDQSIFDQTYTKRTQDG